MQDPEFKPEYHKKKKKKISQSLFSHLFFSSHNLSTLYETRHK